MSSVDPNVVRALVRQALEQKLGVGPTPGRLNHPHPGPLPEGEGVKEAGFSYHPHPASGAMDSGTTYLDARSPRAGEGVNLSVHPSQLAIGEGPADSAMSDYHEDMDQPLQKPCLIEPHRPCYNSGYCKKLGY